MNSKQKSPTFGEIGVSENGFLALLAFNDKNKSRVEKLLLLERLRAFIYSFLNYWGQFIYL